MSKKNFKAQKTWTLLSISTLIMPVIAANTIADINGAGRQDDMRWATLALLVIALLCVIVSIFFIFKLKGWRKVISIVSVALNMPILYLIFYSYSLSFYG